MHGQSSRQTLGNSPAVGEILRSRVRLVFALALDGPPSRRVTLLGAIEVQGPLSGRKAMPPPKNAGEDSWVLLLREL